MKYCYQDYLATKDWILKRMGNAYKAAVILGTGLESLEKLLNIEKVIPYSEIPGFAVSTAPSHKGNLVAGELGGEHFLILSGRFHYYEGYSMEEIVYPVRVLSMLGVRNLIITNGSGGLNTDWEEGDYMVLRDHINFFIESPCRGENLDFLGERFFDISQAYTKEYADLLLEIAQEQGIRLRQGVYAYMPGPQFETYAEVKALHMLGADCVGMSTVHEAIAAAHAGMKVLAVSHIANFAAGLCSGPVECGVVLNDKSNLVRLLKEFLLRI